MKDKVIRLSDLNKVADTIDRVYMRGEAGDEFVNGADTVLQYAQLLPEAVIRCSKCANGKLIPNTTSIICNKGGVRKATFFCGDAKPIEE